VIRFFYALRAAASSLVFAGAALVPAVAATLPPAPASTGSFDAGMLHVDTYGSGPQSLVFIPGLGSGPWSWYGTIAHFAPHYTVYALTLAGFDGRPPALQRPLFGAFATDFWQMLGDHHIDKPVVIGHSLGGTLALVLAEQHPERLRAIVALDGLPVFPAVASKTPAERSAMAAKAAAGYATLDAAKTLAYETNFMRAIGTREASLVDPAAALEAKSDNAAVAAWLQEDLTSDYRPELSKITIPALEIMPYDPVSAAQMGNFTQAQGIAFYQALLAPNVKVEAIAPARHFAMLDRPDALNALLAQFLASLR
jgi:pimeloyl-ACP methyl ester carboxylesterase